MLSNQEGRHVSVMTIENSNINDLSCVTVVGVVAIYNAPKPTNRADHVLNIRLADNSITDLALSLNVRIFNAPGNFPPISGVGDIVLIKNAKITEYGGGYDEYKKVNVLRKNLVVNNLNPAQIVVFDSIRKSLRPGQPNYSATPAELREVENVATWWQKQQARLRDSSKTLQSGRSITTLSEVRDKGFHDLVVEVIDIGVGGDRCVDITVTDYTEGRLLREVRDYELGNMKDENIHKIGLSIACWDEHVEHAVNLAPHTLVFIGNVQTKVLNEGFKGYLRGERTTTRVKRRMQILQPHDPRVQALLQRRFQVVGTPYEAPQQPHQQPPDDYDFENNAPVYQSSFQASFQTSQQQPYQKQSFSPVTTNHNASFVITQASQAIESTLPTKPVSTIALTEPELKSLGNSPFATSKSAQQVREWRQKPEVQPNVTDDLLLNPNLHRERDIEEAIMAAAEAAEEGHKSGTSTLHADMPFTDVAKILEDDKCPNMYNTRAKILAITPKYTYAFCRALCNFCGESCHPGTNAICNSCKKESVNPKYVFMFSFLLESQDCQIPVFVEGDYAEKFMGISACNLFTNPDVVKEIDAKLETLKDKQCVWTMLSYGIKIAGDEYATRYKIVDTFIGDAMIEDE